jgi:hypothetical protein
MMYPDQINALKIALRKYVRPNTLEVRLYIGDVSAFTEANDYYSPAGVPNTLNGVTIIQYSPYAGDSDGCQPIARARVWEEVNSTPAIDRTWAANVNGINKRDGAACMWRRQLLGRNLS